MGGFYFARLNCYYKAYLHVRTGTDGRRTFQRLVLYSAFKGTAINSQS